MSDRLDRAWELRRKVHGWIDAHADASMPEIKLAFERLNPDTVRAVVRRLQGAGFVEARRCGPVNLYRVKAAFDQPRDSARVRLREIGRASGTQRGAQNRTRERLADGTFAPLPPMATARYVNRPGRKQAISGQRGQGAIGGPRSGGCSLGGGL